MPNPRLSATVGGAIPPLAHDGYLPPFVGDPRLRAGRAPYLASVDEFVAKFRFSKWRCEVLAGFLTLRRKLFLEGVRDGFQWVDGSFAANIKPEPGDLDVVTFYHHSDQDMLISNLRVRSLDVYNLPLIKALYHCDWYMINMTGYPSDALVAASLYWYGFFSHTRDNKWKGIVQLRLLGSVAEAIYEYKLQRSLLEGT